MQPKCNQNGGFRKISPTCFRRHIHVSVGAGTFPIVDKIALEALPMWCVILSACYTSRLGWYNCLPVVQKVLNTFRRLLFGVVTSRPLLGADDDLKEPRTFGFIACCALVVLLLCCQPWPGLEQAGLTFYHLNELQDAYRSQEASVVEARACQLSRFRQPVSRKLYK